MNNSARPPGTVLALQIAVAGGVCAFLFFFGLGAFGLVGADEPRYAQIAREMLARHDWITPVLNGQPWLEKPVLLYWNEMISYSLFGVHDWAARIPSAVFATGLVAAIFFFMRRFRAGAEMDAALIAASLAGVIGFARGASTDMQISAPFCVAMLAWWTWHETGKKLWLCGFYAMLAIGTLAKGPVAPGLAVLIVAAYAALRRDSKVFLRTVWLPGFLLYFAITLPWFVAVQMRAPQFFRVFFIEHNLERFGTNLYQHQQPFWYYIPVFLLSVLPWLVYAVGALVEAARGTVRRFWPADEAEDAPAVVENAPWLPCYLLLWIAIPVVFFSISRSKLPGYILPAIPPVAVLTADYLRRLASPGRWRLMLHALICGVLAGGAIIAPWRLNRVTPTSSAWTETAIVMAVVALIVLMAVRRGGLRVLRTATLFPVLMAVGYLLRPASHAVDEAISARAVQARLAAAGSAQVAVFKVKREVEYGLNFYRNQPIVRYERDGVPVQAHLLVAGSGLEDEIEARIAPRRAVEIGRIPQQRLTLFLVSNTR